MRLLNTSTLKLTLAAICLFAAVYLIAVPNSLQRLANSDSLKGLQTSFSLDDQYLSGLSPEKPFFITAVFAGCPSTCPANLQTLARLQDTFHQEVEFALISLDLDASASSVKSWSEQVLPGAIVIHVNSEPELRQLMRQLPEPFLPANSSLHHTGAIYLMHPQKAGLIKYRPQDHDFILTDLLYLQQHRPAHEKS